jgi:20S proteasome subunit alpha 3
VQVLSKTLDMTKLSPEKIEIATLTRVDNKTNIQILAAPKVEFKMTVA